MNFRVHVDDINNAAGKLSDAKSPLLSAGGPPNVGSTPGAGDFAADYAVWLKTRQEDLKGADQQVEVLVANIRAAAKTYDDREAGAADTFMNALDGGFTKIDR